MSTSGRGRGYSGRHQQRDARPGDAAPAPAAAPMRQDVSPRISTSQTDQKPDIDSIQLPNKPLEPMDEPRPSTTCERGLSAEDEASMKELLNVEEQFAPLLALLEQFCPGEDGIQFNRKLRAFESTVTAMCPDEARLHQAFATFRAAALVSAGTARRLAAVGASFTRQQRQQLLRGALLNVVMQGTFFKLELLERASPSIMINAANLMGDYFAEARLCNGNKVHILAAPLLRYLRALLAADDLRAHRTLAIQLMQNGRELLAVLPQELDELSISIRLRLLSLPPVSIIWLLLSADLCLNKFLPLPNSLQQFYASHLELTTEENYSEVCYGSWRKTPEKELEEKVSQSATSVSQLNISQEEETKPKLRPILGAGAGLLRQEQAQSTTDFESWTTKNSLTKRYDLNSWRQNEEEKEEEYPTVLPQEFTNRFPNYQENFANYLQQGDGAYIQNQYQSNANFTPQGDFVPYDRQFERFNNETTEFVQQYPEKPPAQERVHNEVQKSSRKLENWRKDKPETKDDQNKNKPKNWTRQLSKDNRDEEEKPRTPNPRPGNRLNRRNSNETEDGSVMSKTPPRRHVMEAPRNHKYWDHDDRCDKDYNS